jgi:hypothetical protein
MAMDPAIEEQLTEIVEQERELGQGKEAEQLEEVVQEQGAGGPAAEAPGPGEPDSPEPASEAQPVEGAASGGATAG